MGHEVISLNSTDITYIGDTYKTFVFTDRDKNETTFIPISRINFWVTNADKIKLSLTDSSTIVLRIVDSGSRSTISEEFASWFNHVTHSGLEALALTAERLASP